MVSTYRKTEILGHPPGDDDWLVMLDGRRVSRVYISHLPEPQNLWFWAAWSNPSDQGYAPSLEAALELVRDRVRRLGAIPWLPPSGSR